MHKKKAPNQVGAKWKPYELCRLVPRLAFAATTPIGLILLAAYATGFLLKELRPEEYVLKAR